MPPNTPPQVSFQEDPAVQAQFLQEKPSALMRFALSTGLAKNEKEAQQLLLYTFIGVGIIALGVWWTWGGSAPLPPPPPMPGTGAALPPAN